MKALAFESATMTVADDHAVHVFRDGRINVMPLTHPSHDHHAPLAGYRDPRRYIIEHDAVHHMLADWRGLPHSPALYLNSQLPLDQAPDEIKLEEHVVQRTVRLIMLGDPDPHGVLPDLFCAGLPGWLASVQFRLDRELGPLRRWMDRR